MSGVYPRPEPSPVPRPAVPRPVVPGSVVPRKHPPARPRGEAWDAQAYSRIRRGRDLLLSPLAVPLAALRVPPAAISVLGVGAASSLLWTLGRHPWLALAGWLGALLADALDGAVARLRDCGSARGKLVDQGCDALTFAVLVAAAWKADDVSPAAALFAVASCTLVLLIGMARGARLRGPTWWDNPRAGFAAHLPKGFFLVALPLHLVGGPSWLDPALWLGTAVAGLTLVAWAVAGARSRVDRPR